MEVPSEHCAGWGVIPGAPCHRLNPALALLCCIGPHTVLSLPSHLCRRNWNHVTTCQIVLFQRLNWIIPVFTVRVILDRGCRKMLVDHIYHFLREVFDDVAIYNWREESLFSYRK